MPVSVKFILPSVLTIILYGWAFYNSSQSPSLQAPFVPSFQPLQEKQATGPFFHEEFLHPPQKNKIAHASSVSELADQSLHAVWYAGSREGAKDVVIYYSTRKKGDETWSSPQILVDRESAAKELQRYVRKVGNPVVFTDQEQRLWMVYVTISVGGWSVSSLNVKISEDGGSTWSRSKRLTLSPFFNISELVRSPPVHLADGGFVLPIAHECFGLFSELLKMKLQPDGTLLYTKKRLSSWRVYEQPCMVAFDANAAAVFHRSCTGENIGISTSKDSGRSWSEAGKTSLPNPHAGISALLLADQRLLMSFNNSNTGREDLTLAISDDGGKKWQNVAALEKKEEGNYSYPHFLQSSDGHIHLLYTWEQVGIKHVTFNRQWLDRQVIIKQKP